MSLKDRVVVVTGAGGEIGRVYCAALADLGANVIAADIDLASARRTCASIGNGATTPYELDVADRDSSRNLGIYLRQKFGRCDVLVNNAGIYDGMRLDAQMTVDYDYWRRVMAVNVDGALLCTQALAPLMVEAGWGRVINQTSIAAYQGNGGHYGVSKLALIGLTQGFARELGAHGVTVNAIAPGPIFTGSTLRTMSSERLERRLSEMPISRRAQPDELVGMLVFLLSDAASWITGQTHIVDGGLVNRL